MWRQGLRLYQSPLCLQHWDQHMMALHHCLPADLGRDRQRGKSTVFAIDQADCSAQYANIYPRKSSPTEPKSTWRSPVLPLLSGATDRRYNSPPGGNPSWVFQQALLQVKSLPFPLVPISMAARLSFTLFVPFTCSPFGKVPLR